MAELLEKSLDIRYVYTGDIFRQMAKEKGMKLEIFGEYVSKHQEIDRELDRRQTELTREKDIIVEGRLAGYMAYSNGIGSYKIWLYAPFEVRMGRVGNREKKGLEIVKKENSIRERGERSRYIDIYGFDMNDTSIYDITIDSSKYLAEEIVDLIIEDMRSRNIL